MVPMALDIVSSPQVLGKRASILNQPNPPALAKLSSALSDMECLI
jgi:hypothetical protein